MATRQEQLIVERQRAMNEVLISECRSPAANAESLETILLSGADVRYKHAKCLYWAAKLLRFDIIKILIKHDVLLEPAAVNYIAAMCDNKGFDEECELPFFEVLDLSKSKNVELMTLITPYINHMAVNGRMDKLQELMKRYYLTESETANAIYIRIIFEIILNAHDEVLEFVNRHVNWMDQTSFDLAVSSGDWVVLEYILNHSGLRIPSDKAVAEAVYTGAFEVLDMLLACGYSFNKKPLFLKQACRAAFSDGAQSLEYLLKRGYSLSDCYDGASIIQNARADKNKRLLAYLGERESIA